MLRIFFSRSSKKLALLTREHRGARRFARNLKKGLDNRTSVAELSFYVRWYWSNFLQPHFDREENIVMAKMPDRDEMVEWLRLEHANITELITGDLNKATMTNLAAVIKYHVRFEERRFFPYVSKKLKKELLRTIFSELSQQTYCTEKWTDRFWERKLPMEINN
jgi:hemerythrin-like domain-containing protein